MTGGEKPQLGPSQISPLFNTELVSWWPPIKRNIWGLFSVFNKHGRMMKIRTNFADACAPVLWVVTLNTTHFSPASSATILLFHCTMVALQTAPGRCQVLKLRRAAVATMALFREEVETVSPLHMSRAVLVSGTRSCLLWVTHLISANDSLSLLKFSR